MCDYDGGDCCLQPSNCLNFCSGDECLCHETGVINCDVACDNYDWIGDGFCDGSNNNQVCLYDGGDCCHTLIECSFCNGGNCTCHETGLSYCPDEEACEAPNGINDGYCDNEANSQQCNYDGGDCCLQPSKCFSCGANECNCHETGLNQCGCLDFSEANDGYCDGYNNYAECDYDGGDCCLASSSCLLTCHGDGCICHETGQLHCADTNQLCSLDSWINDGHCHQYANNEECHFDGGDCCMHPSICLTSCYEGEGSSCLCHETGLNHCKCKTMSDANNGVCDGFNNNDNCEYDSGDCCLEEAKCTNCLGDDCICNSTGLSHCTDTHLGCDNHYMISNGVCDGDNNNDECKFDGGDCCLEPSFCLFTCEGDDCLCHETGSSHCCYNIHWSNDGFCDESNNNLQCLFDGSDCCVEEADCSYCEGDGCICHETGISHCSGNDASHCDKPLIWIGDGLCDPGANKLECDYDGGDCCLQPSNCSVCYDSCLCHETGIEHCNCQFGLTDEKCDGTKNTAEFCYDLGDCCLKDVICHNCGTEDDHDCICHQTSLSHCESCEYPEWQDDGYCDGVNNHHNCNYDGGDCCVDAPDCSYCLEDGCICHDTGLSHCSTDCLFPYFVGDGSCQGIMNTEQCAYDGGDCCLDTLSFSCSECVLDSCHCHITGYSYCNASTNGVNDVSCEFPQSIGNEVCLSFSNTAECNYDGGDCCLDPVNCAGPCQGDLCNCHETGQSNCPAQCWPDWRGDTFCDGVNNHEDCNFDDGDCCYEHTDCTFCMGDDCVCHEIGMRQCFGDTGDPPEGCKYPQWLIGNGFCEGYINSEACNFDGGDCCLEDPACDSCYIAGWCACHATGLDYCTHQPSCNAILGDNKGNGICDEVFNNDECGYDGGDCCIEPSNCEDSCEGNGCLCHETGQVHCSPVDCGLTFFAGDGFCDGDMNREECSLPCALENWMMGDGFCHGISNVEECNFDGGDCCLQDANCDFCTGDSCICHDTSVRHC